MRFSAQKTWLKFIQTNHTDPQQDVAEASTGLKMLLNCNLLRGMQLKASRLDIATTYARK